MRKKRGDQRGFTLVEMLCATLILVMLALVTGVGLRLALRSYRAVRAESETQLLLSTALDALADDLRYARDVKTKAGPEGPLLDTYRSDSYGQGVALELDGENQLLAGGKRVLPPGAYGNGAYQVRELRVLCGQGGFTIHLAVGEGNGDITASTPEEGVFVLCLNRLTEGEAP